MPVITTIQRLLVSDFLADIEKSELHKILAAGRKGNYEQESLGIPANSWPFFSTATPGLPIR
ncbi:MAG: hypothetical protein WCH43_11715 [Verrucomicrobiota bacterium]